jgi:hypothetical protein
MSIHRNKMALMLMVCTSGVALATPAMAATVGYWRFESDVTTDSGPNGLTLTANSGGTAPSSVANTNFPSPVAGQPNNGMANMPSPGNSASLSRADEAIFQLSDFTIEGYGRLDDTGGTTWSVIAGQRGNTGNQRGWQFQRDNAAIFVPAGNLFMVLSADGSNNFAADSGFQIALDTNYYFAAAVDFGGASTSVTFWLQDLSANGPLLTSTVSGLGLTAMHNSTTAFRIGAQENGAEVNNWFGALDEIRLSDVALAQGDLLPSQAVPEPASLSILALGGLAMLVRSRRNR